MKKIISLFIFFVLIINSFAVFAHDDVLYGTLEETKLAETYVSRPMRFFSARKTIEQTLVDGWNNLSAEINIRDYNIPVSELGYVYSSIVYNHPKMYFVSTGCRYTYNPITNTVATVLPQYFETDTEVIDQTMQSIDEATEEVMMYLDESMTDFEKIMAVHDYMVLHYDYDYTYSNYDITIMTTKTGVCMSYAFAFKHIMNELGIECLYVSSDKEMNHAWNLVNLDGEWYHIDLTWDDPGSNYGQVRHEYALLSDFEIQHLESPHYGYDLRGLEAASDKYDKEHWHEGVGAIATIDGLYYYVDGNDLVDQNGEIIYSGLDGGDGYWDIGGGYYLNGNFTGIAEYNGCLYFNTDNAVYSYNPHNEKTVKILDYEGLCGSFVDKNKLEYCKFDMSTRNFVKAGDFVLGKIRFGGTFHKDGKIIKRICKEDDAEDIYVLANCNDCAQIQKITKSDVSKISFDFKECQELYFWNKYMKPLKAKEVYDN